MMSSWASLANVGLNLVNIVVALGCLLLLKDIRDALRRDRSA